MSETLLKAARRVRGPRGLLRELFHELALRGTYNPDGREQVTVSIDTVSADICSRRWAKKLVWQLCHTVDEAGAPRPLLEKTKQKRHKDGTLGICTYTFLTPFPASVVIPALGDIAAPGPGDMVSLDRACPGLRLLSPMSTLYKHRRRVCKRCLNDLD